MIKTCIKGIDLILETSPDLFSPKGIDLGTMSMLSVVDFQKGDKVLDLGCGYGVVGILAAKLVGEKNVIMVDVEQEAVGLSKRNSALNGVPGVKVIRSDGFANLSEKCFTLILSNPPYHSDFSVAKTFVEKGFNRLNLGGKMYMVTKRKEWYKNKFVAIFGGVKIWELSGYFVFMAQKRTSSYAKKKPRKLKTQSQPTVDSQFELAQKYIYGDGVPEDLAKAVKLLKIAASRGHVEAYYNFGFCYQYGYGVPIDHEAALRYYTQSGRLGHPKGRTLVGFFYFHGLAVQQDYREAFGWFSDAAKQGDPKAQYWLGVCYANGCGVCRGEADAINWYQKSAEQGYPEAVKALAKLTDK